MADRIEDADVKDLFLFFRTKQHAHAEKVTVTAAYLIHI